MRGVCICLEVEEKCQLKADEKVEGKRGNHDRKKQNQQLYQRLTLLLDFLS